MASSLTVTTANGEFTIASNLIQTSDSKLSEPPVNFLTREFLMT